MLEEVAKAFGDCGAVSEVLEFVLRVSVRLMALSLSYIHNRRPCLFAYTSHRLVEHHRIARKKLMLFFEVGKTGSYHLSSTTIYTSFTFLENR